MASKKPTQPPALDAANMVKGGTPAAQKFPVWKRWVEATGEFDGKGLRDVVNSNAVMLDDVKTDVDEHSARLGSAESRLAALEAQPVTRFP
jgi:hypothetical protein